MRTAIYWFRPALCAVAIGFLALSQPASAQPKKPADAKALDKAVYDSVGAVINHGADLFNTYGDYAGCYHSFHAGLIAVRPFLAHRPDLQKTIDEGLASAEERRRVMNRAFALRKVLGTIRKQTAPGATPAVSKTAPEKSPGTAEKKIEKRIDLAKPTEQRSSRNKVGKRTTSPPAQAMARLSGKVTYKGHPLSDGWYVTLVSASDKHTFSTYVRGGEYAFKTPLPPGNYAAAIEEGPRDKGSPSARAAIPERYQNPVTSGLMLQIQPGPNSHDVNLQ
jgi:hypothetical protein